MTSVTLEQAQAEFPTLVRGLPAGQEVAITDGGRQVARLVAVAPVMEANPAGAPLRPVNIMPGSVLYMAPDFDELTDSSAPMCDPPR